MSTTPAALAHDARERLVTLGTEEADAATRRYFRTGEAEYAEGMNLVGVRMGTVFAHAKEAAGLRPEALHLLRRGNPHEGLRVALPLLEDGHYMVRKPVGGLVREVGRHHRDLIRAFLDDHAGRMPRVALTYAMEHLAPDQRAHLARSERVGHAGQSATPRSPVMRVGWMRTSSSPGTPLRRP